MKPKAIKNFTGVGAQPNTTREAENEPHALTDTNTGTGTGTGPGTIADRHADPKTRTKRELAQLVSESGSYALCAFQVVFAAFAPLLKVLSPPRSARSPDAITFVSRVNEQYGA